MAGSWLERFAADERHPTPCAGFDVDEALGAYDRLLAAFRGRVRVQYAVKARPDDELLSALARRGSGFDVVSPLEIERALGAGCPPRSLSCSNAFAGRDELAHARDRGVLVFTADTPAMIERLAAARPAASVFLRLAQEHVTGAAIPLGGRFGCPETEAVELALLAAARGLDVAGLSWHVGSQQSDPKQWERAVGSAARVARRLRRRGVDVPRLNLGGGMPGTYRSRTPSVETYARVILAAVDAHFPPPHQPELVIEPGRALVADAGVTTASVKAVVRRPWGTYVVLDAGLWNAGLLDNLCGIEYRITYPGHPDGRAVRPVTFCGPTCDSLDSLTAADSYRAPVGLAAGDRVAIWSTGAYCATSALVGFNGYPPVPQFVHAPPR
ncbi:hypothetical protein ACSNOK_14025 [Streptomyces sp. URMC 126]|uniref:hypothetical protein n=1 Tax=Streptomyces sp. URMC 126 TaxID=3423401 RepID=UPI003F1DD439